MKIQKLTLDDNDMKQAVQSFLATKGITIPVESVTREYSWRDFEVNFQDDEAKKSAPPAVSPASLPEIEPLPQVMSAERLAESLTQPAGLIAK